MSWLSQRPCGPHVRTHTYANMCFDSTQWSHITIDNDNTFNDDYKQKIILLQQAIIFPAVNPPLKSKIDMQYLIKLYDCDEKQIIIVFSETAVSEKTIIICFSSQHASWNRSASIFPKYFLFFFKSVLKQSMYTKYISCHFLLAKLGTCIIDTTSRLPKITMTMEKMPHWIIFKVWWETSPKWISIISIVLR